jgi:hypothetical protein
MKCQDCECTVRTLYLDPRVPPLDDESCLCDSCFQVAAETRIEELQSEVEDLRVSKIRRLQRGPVRM